MLLSAPTFGVVENKPQWAFEVDTSADTMTHADPGLILPLWYLYMYIGGITTR